MRSLIEDPARSAEAHGDRAQARKSFFTDTSICIGCKACEVACKEWNRNPMDSDLGLLESSYDNTGSLGANTWRHVAFVEQDQERIQAARESGRKLVSLGMPGWARRRPVRPHRAEPTGTPLPRTPMSSGGSCPQTCANTAPMPAVWTSVPPAPCTALSSAR